MVWGDIDAVRHQPQIERSGGSAVTCCNVTQCPNGRFREVNAKDRALSYGLQGQTEIGSDLFDPFTNLIAKVQDYKAFKAVALINVMLILK